MGYAHAQSKLRCMEHLQHSHRMHIDTLHMNAYDSLLYIIVFIMSMICKYCTVCMLWKAGSTVAKNCRHVMSPLSSRENLPHSFDFELMEF